MTKIVHAVKGGLLSYCDKVYSRGNINQKHHIGGVMVSVLVWSKVDRGFEPRSGQTKNYKIGICCFSTKQAALRSRSKDWLAQNQNNVFGLSNMSSHSGHSTPARHRTNCTSNCIFSTPTVFSKMIMSK